MGAVLQDILSRRYLSANDANPVLQLTQSGAGSALNIISGVLIMPNNTAIQMRRADGDLAAQTVLYITTGNRVNLVSPLSYLDLNREYATDITMWGGAAGTGRTLIINASDAASGAGNVSSSPTIMQRALYRDGANALQAWDATVLHSMTTGGATPASSVVHAINSVTVLTLTNTDTVPSAVFPGVTTIRTGDSSCSPQGDAILVLERATWANLHIMTTNNTGGGIYWGDGDVDQTSYIIYRHTTDDLVFNIGTVTQLLWTDGAMAFQKATTISTTAGDLFLDPTGDVILPAAAATDGQTNDAPLFTLRNYYDANPAAVDVTSTAWDLTLLHDMTAGGAAPASSGIFKINSVAVLTLTNTNTVPSATFPGSIKFTNVLLKEATTNGGTNGIITRNVGDTAAGDFQANWFYPLTGIYMNAAAEIRAFANDSSYFFISARDNDTDAAVEVMRFVSASNPYVSTGGSQQNKFYNSGLSVFGADVQFETAIQMTSATGAIRARNTADGDYFTIEARDSDTDALVEVGRVVGATDPYFAMGGTQQFKFYNSGVADFGTVQSNITIGLGATNTNSPYVIFTADNADTNETAAIRLNYGTDPYLVFEVSASSASPARVDAMYLKDTALAFTDNFSLTTNTADDDLFTIKAVENTGNTLVEVARAAGAADPYLSMGGSQQFKFYNSGVAAFGGIVTLSAQFNANSQVIDSASEVSGPNAAGSILTFLGRNQTASAIGIQLRTWNTALGAYLNRIEITSAADVAEVSVRNANLNVGTSCNLKRFYQEITLDTGDAETAVGLTPGAVVLSAAIRVSVQIIDLDSADHHIQLGINGSASKYIDVAQGAAATTIDVNKKGNYTFDPTVGVEAAALVLTITGGADQIPSAGKVYVEVVYLDSSDLADV